METLRWPITAHPTWNVTADWMTHNSKMDMNTISCYAAYSIIGYLFHIVFFVWEGKLADVIVISSARDTSRPHFAISKA